MTESLLDDALRATYQLSPAGSGRLRRLTAASGLSTENVLSRVAIVRSLQVTEPVTPKNTPGNKGKEIKGATLLGRPGPASLLITMILKAASVELDLAGLKPLVIGHWERGLDLLHRETGGGSVIDLLATELQTASRGVARVAAGPARVGGHGDTGRESVAAALGREFGVLPIEVRRLLVLVGRFDRSRARDAAVRLLEEVRSSEGTARVSESQALRVVGGWGLNRLGMTAGDRGLLSELMTSDRAVFELDIGQLAALEFLQLLGLARTTSDGVLAQASPYARELGAESWTS